MNAGGRSYAVLLAVALAASVTSLRNGFVYDDVPAVEQDARIHSLRHPSGLLTISYWKDDIRDRIYRPITTASFAMDWAAGGGSPLAFHVTNVALHLVVCLLVFMLARRVLGGEAAALVAAFWFAVHPLHVEVVANVVGRSELLAAAGYLGAVLAYAAEGEAAAARPAGARRAVLALLVLGCSAIACGGKEHALTLPAALILTDAWAGRNEGLAGSRRALARHAITWAGALAVAIGYLGARHAVLGTTFGGGSVGAGLENLDGPGRAVVMAPAMLVWARLLLVPLRLSADYSPDHFVPQPTLTLAHAAGAALVAAVLFAAWNLRRRVPALTFGIVWLFLTAAIAANVIFPTGVLLAERVLYLPSVGVALALGALWRELRGRAVWPVTAVVLVLLAARTLTRVPVWRDAERFYTALVHDAPDSYRSHWATGARAFERKHPREGEIELLNAIRIYPGDGVLLQELGEHYVSAQMWAPADRFLTVAWRVDSLRTDAAIQAVLARIRLGRPDSALALGIDALRRFPTAPALLLATSDAYLALGKPVPALTYRRRIAFVSPLTWQYQYAAAEGAARAGRCYEARMRAERAAQLAPGDRAPRALLDRIGVGPTCGVT
ncbi:MAG: tetratricopeptide repeat protein [Gemmatimonadales bacterium]